MKVIAGLIKFYQYTLGIILPPSCRFTPSCSHYALDAVMTHGIIKGVLLAGWRILRCNPWCAGGFDPVPPAGSWKQAFTRSGTCKAGGYE